MKSIFLSIFVILTVFAVSASAQSLSTRQTFEKGIGLANAEKFEAALADFRKSLTLAEIEDARAEFHARIHFNIGVCWYRMKENEKAVGEFEAAIKLTKNDYEKAFYALGMAQAELKNWTQAERAFRGALRLNRRNGEAWFDLAFVYLAKNDFEAAKQAFQKSVAYQSVSAAVGHNNLGVIFALGGDLDRAVREFETALRISNGNFAVAERNLQFCKSWGKNFSREQVAILEFGNK